MKHHAEEKRQHGSCSGLCCRGPAGLQHAASCQINAAVSHSPHPVCPLHIDIHVQLKPAVETAVEMFAQPRHAEVLQACSMLRNLQPARLMPQSQTLLTLCAHCM